MKKVEINMGTRLSPLDILRDGPVIPVIVIGELAHAVPLAQALVAAGVRVLEITLRSEVALAAIREISREVPEALVGAGTVLNSDDLKNVAAAGGCFAISPGLTPNLLTAAAQGSLPLIPGISTASELMMGLEAGLDCFKFFPAGAAGGLAMLKSLAGPFAGVTFCPTGGIGPDNYRDYLALTNVACVGGSWLAPPGLVAAGDWPAITEIARTAREQAGKETTDT
jgi:2-dehydro-3-deoxyphosphogluconate aldolase/(4S)-4-hydroxy-2-oxoglutarate aldolase